MYTVLDFVIVVILYVVARSAIDVFISLNGFFEMQPDLAGVCIFILFFPSPVVASAHHLQFSF